MNISIKQPCNERLAGAFTSQSFCLKCTKQIEDLSWLTPEEIHARFIAEHGKLCGTIYLGQSFDLPKELNTQEKMMLQPDFLKRSLISGMLLLTSFSFAAPTSTPKLTYPIAYSTLTCCQSTFSDDSLRLEGKVLDDLSGDAVVMAKVFLKVDGKEWITVTDLNGNYSFILGDTMEGKIVDLTFSAIDFIGETQTITLTKDSPLLITKLYSQAVMIEGMMIEIPDEPVEPKKHKKSKS